MAGGLLGVGSSALLTAYTQLQTTGHNIANANTVGYSRQEVVLASAGADYTGAGFVGRGVNIVDVRRRYDRFVNEEVMTSTAASAADRARSDQLARLDELFSDPTIGISAAFDDLGLAMADVVNRPADPSGRAVVLARADTLAARVRGIDTSIADLRDTVEGRIGMTVQSLNDSMQRLARLNDQISQAGASEIKPNDLFDQRDQLLVEINQSMKANAYFGPDGSVNVFATGGQALVVGNRAAQVATRPDPADATRSQLLLKTDGASIPLDTRTLGGGTLTGLLQVRDQDLAAARNRIGQLAASIAGAYNTQQRAGLDINGTPGTDLFNIGTPIVTAVGTPAGNARFTLAVADASKLKPSDYQLDFDGAQYSVTRASDGVRVAQFAPPAAGETVELESEGLELTLNSGAAATRDRFALRSASMFARDFDRALGTPSGLAAAVSMVPQLGNANTGTLRINAFSADPAGSGAVTLQFTSPTTFDVPDASPPVSGRAYTPGERIEIDGWSMTLTGAPRAGDTLSVVPTASVATDNRNARELVSLSKQLLADGATISEAYGATVADVGTRTQASQAATQMSGQLLDNANAARAAAVGVNLDEEAARLVQFQQAYQAAAKLIQTVQNMFQTLLDAAR